MGADLFDDAERKKNTMIVCSIYLEAQRRLNKERPMPQHPPTHP
jgi:hypothetical protein